MPRSNQDIFKDTVFDVPKRRHSDSIISFIRKDYAKFKKAIKQLKSPIAEILEPKMAIIKMQCDLILESLELYLKGHTSASYLKLSECLNEVNATGTLPIQELPKAGSQNLYRIRIANNNQLQKGQLFHIPFELRERVSTQRYSIPGLPCLYLADSIFVCWEELGRPDINQIQVSRFDLSHFKFKFLYFNVNTDDIRRRCFSSDPKGKFVNQLVSFLTYWPILAACSIVVERPLDPFKPEYIIPQLVLQWVVSEKNLDGIQYRSNRIKANAHSVGSFKNVVIPVSDLNDHGFCTKLAAKVQLTNPISWQLLDITNAAKARGKSTDYKVADLRSAMFVELIGGEQSLYVDSKFGLMEEKLKSMKPSLLDM
jgi:hypothetical protein